jgi:hypothetical protein
MAKKKRDPEINEDRAQRNDDGTVTVLLKYPVVLKKGTVDEVTIKRPKGKNLTVMDDETGAVSGSLLLVAGLTGQPMKVAKELDAYDLTQINLVIEEMMSGNSPESEDGGGEQ